MALCPGYFRPQVRKLNENCRTRVTGMPWCSCSPVAGSISSAGILCEYRVADSHQVRADSRPNMHCSPWLDDEDAILAHSRHADGNNDSALNSSVCINEMPVAFHLNHGFV